MRHSAEAIEAEPDPHKRSRLRYGNAPGAVDVAIMDATVELVQGAWSHVAGKRAIIELWWRGEPTPKQRTEAARAAVSALLAWTGTTREAWEALRVRKGRERPQDGKRRLPPLEP